MPFVITITSVWSFMSSDKLFFAVPHEWIIEIGGWVRLIEFRHCVRIRALGGSEIE